MKKYFVSSLVLVTLLVSVVAQEELPNPGITPDSWLYGLDRAIEALQKAFALTPEARAKLALQLAEERLAEAKEMERKGYLGLATSTAEDYTKEIEEAKRYGEAIAEVARQRDVKEVISRATSIHVRILEKVNPDEPLYLAKRKAEDIGIDVALTLDEKAKLQLSAAERRVEEARRMVEAGKPNLAREVAEDYEDQLSKAMSYGETIAELAKKREFETLVAEATFIHIDVLSEVMEKVPEQAKPAIGRAINTSKRGHEKSLERIGNIDPIEAAKLQLNFSTRILEKIKAEIGRGEVEKAKKLAEEYRAKINKSLEIVEKVKEAKLNITEISEKVIEVTSQHLKVLRDVLDRVPEEAKLAIERAMNVSARGQEKALEALGAISPEKVKEIEKIISEEVKEIRRVMSIPVGATKPY